VAFILPLAFIQSPSQEYTRGLAFVPVVNVAMMFREAIEGRYDLPLILITLAVEAVCIVLALKCAITVVEYEDFVTGNYQGTFLKFAGGRIFGRRKARGAVES